MWLVGPLPLPVWNSLFTCVIASFCCEKNSRRAISQNVMVLYFVTLQPRHCNGVSFWRCRFTIPEQLSCIFTICAILILACATKVFPKPPRLELHIISTLIAGYYGAVITFDDILPFLNEESLTIWIISADMELSVGIN